MATEEHFTPDTITDTSESTDAAATAAGANGDHPTAALVPPISTPSEIHPEPCDSSNHSVLIIDDEDDDEEDEKRPTTVSDDGSSSDSGGCEIISVDSDEEDDGERRWRSQYSTLDSVVKLINSSSRILVLTGAGISVSCGIPDFRSRDGIYARLAQDYPDLTSPQAMFEMDFFLHNPLPFF
ncbi:unnamed protein product, partial [Dibothriocephalus latus]